MTTNSPRAASARWLESHQIARIRAQFALIAPQAELFAEEFYERLFARMPGAREMFKGDMREQGAKLTRMLAILVSKLDVPDQLEAPLMQLGQRHRGYGVKAADFEPVAAALLTTLAHRLGDEFDDEARTAWTAVYLRAAEAMQKPMAAAA